jgi:signal transduction histidine kinase/CheY-like chemotaxis protein
MQMKLSFSGVERLSLWLLRDEQPERQVLNQVQLLVSCMVVGVLMALLSFVIELLGARWVWGMAALPAFMLTISGLLLLLRAGWSLDVVLSGEMVAVTLFLVFMSVQSITLQLHQLYWFSLIPLSGGLLSGRRGLLKGGVFSLLGGASTAWLYERGWVFADDGPPLNHVIALDFCVFIVSTALLAGAYDELRARAVERAERAVKARGDFLATMSHELRTPMNGVIGMAQVLEQSSLDADQRSQLAVVRRSGEAMVALINDLLDFAKIEAGQLRIDSTATSVRAELADVLRLAQPLAEGRGVRLRSDVAPEVPEWGLGDPLRLRQIIHNLVGNAVKFTRDGAVEVSLRWDRGVLVGVVRDEGVGMSPAVLARLFTPFEQATAGTARESGGTGLGLTITRALCQRMNGDVEVESAPGAGSRFTFRCALPACEAPAASTISSGAPGRLVGRVLLVEDNAVNQLVARRLCELRGLEVDLAVDGAKAVEMAQGASYDLVLMDCQLPVWDGYEATRRIRALQGPAARVPIVGLTASALSEDVRRCEDAGMDEVEFKPVDAQRLGRVLERYARQASAGPAATSRSAPPGPSR